MFSFVSDKKTLNFAQNTFKRKELIMCKTFDAIQKLAKKTESDSIVIWVGHKKISGRLYMCDDGKCMDEIVTLQDATIESCSHGDECKFHEFKWLNIPSHAIKAFTFKCCLK